MFQLIGSLYLCLLACASLAYAGSLWRRFRRHEISWALVSWTLGTLCLSAVPAFIYVAGMMFHYIDGEPIRYEPWMTAIVSLWYLFMLAVGTTIAVLIATGPGGSVGLIVGLVLSRLCPHDTTVLGCRLGTRSGTSLLARLDVPETDVGELVLASTVGWALFLFGIWFVRAQHWQIFS